MDSWKVSQQDMSGRTWRPVLKVRVLSKQELEESQSGKYFLGLHNPDMALLCYPERTFVKIGPNAPALDRMLKEDMSVCVECPTCGFIHNLYYEGDGWALLSIPV